MGSMMDEQINPKQMVPLRVLLIEDDPADAQTVRLSLSKTRGAMEVRRGLFSLSKVDRLARGLQRLARESFDVVLLDLHLPDSQGLKTLAEVRAAAGDVPVVVLAGSDDEGLALAAIRQGAQDCVAKDGLDGRLLSRTIHYAVERKRTEVQLMHHAREVEAARARIEQQAAELKARAEQLDRINRELDDFTYIASHDLKEPLRGIAGYCEILLEDYQDKLDEQGQCRLRATVRLCDRLETLIDDLLTYCRVGGARPADTGIDLGAVRRSASWASCPRPPATAL